MTSPQDAPKAPPAVSLRRIDAALDTLGDLAGQEHPELTGEVRDAIGRVRHALHDMADRCRS